MGAAYMDLGRHREASPHLERALTIYEEDLNEVRHIRYAGIAMMLGSALRAQKDYQHSRERLEAALDVHREVVDEEHQDTAKNLMNLGTLLREQADEDDQLSDAERGEALASARGHLEEALTLSEGLYGHDHPITGGVLRELADLARAEDQSEVERSYQERAEEIREEFLGSVNAGAADELDQGARSLRARGLFDEAMRYQRHSLQLRTDAFGEEGLQTATGLLDLARLLQLQGRDEEARSYLRQALAIHERVLGEGDPVTELVRENLAALGAPPR
jgi:tetratricopeptide (TPR) repeat protein